MAVAIGIDEKHRKKIADGLSEILADTYLLYLKTQNFHWNVTGSHFAPLHLFFESLYKELAEAVDVLAERIRALGYPVLATFTKFLELAHLKEETSIPHADEMVHILLKDNEAISVSIRKWLIPVTDAEDAATENLLADRLDVHEKAAWMLRSSMNVK